MNDEHGLDHKILSVAVNDPFFHDIDTLAQLPKHYLDEIFEFFNTYKKLENHKYAIPTKWEGIEHAHKIILKAIADFKAKYGDIAHIDPMAEV